MENTIISLKRKLDTLTVFRGLLEDPAIESFMDLAFEIKDYLEDKSMEDDEDCFSAADPSEAVSAYCRFVSDIYSAGVSSAGRPAGDLSAYVRDLVMRDENFYVIGKAAGRKIGKQIEDSLERELAVLREFSQLTSAKAKKALPDVPAGTDLPSWRTSSTDLVSEYREMIEKLPVTGYGMYARYRAEVKELNELLDRKR